MVKKKPGKPLHEQAYEKIKHLIITLQFQPGTYLNEAYVSDLISMGRTPVHQALNRLILEGMVEVIPRKGFIVKAVSLNEVMEIIDVRLINEVECVRLAAARASEKDIESLSKIFEISAEATKNGDIEQQMLLDREFHEGLSKAANNVVLGDLLRNLHERSLRFWFISLTDAGHHKSVLDEHRVILDAIKSHDQDAAAAAIKIHIESFRKNITAQI